MKPTEFLDPIDLLRILKGVKEGDEKAESILVRELDRLRNRIMNLELQAGQLYRILENNKNQKPEIN